MTSLLKISGKSISKSSFKSIAWLVLILVFAYLIYSPARSAGFTNWDDPNYVSNNEEITSFDKYKYKVFTKAYEGSYQPLTMISFMMEYSLVKLNPKLYHLDNILLHLINIILAYWLLFLLSKNREVSLIGAALFATHPLQVESVSWISERNNLLYTLFFLSALIAYMNYVKKGKGFLYMLSIFFFILSLFSKGLAVSLSLTLLAIDFVLERNILSKKVLLEKLPFFTLSLILGLVSVATQASDSDQVDWMKNDPINNPWYEKFLYATYNAGHYILKLIFPFNLAAFYPYPEKTNGLLPLQYYIILLTVIAASIWFTFWFIRKKNSYSRFILFGILFYLMNIAIVLQLIPVGAGGAIQADRYTYLPSIGIFLLIGIGFDYVSKKHPQTKKIFLAIAGIYIAGLSLISYERCKVWENGITLWTDEINKYPTLAFAYANRGHARSVANDMKGALEDYNKGIQLDSTYYKAYYNKGVIEYVMGNYQEAFNNFNKTLEINPRYSIAYAQRAAIKFSKGDYQGTLEDYNKYLQLNPDNAQIYIVRGWVYLQLKQYENAVNDYTKTIELLPHNVEAYTNRGLAKFFLKDSVGAKADYNKALELNPEFSDAYYYRAQLNLQLAPEEACIDLYKAVEYGHEEAVQVIMSFCR